MTALSCDDALEQPLPEHVLEALERQIGVHGAGAVPHQQRDVVHFARIAGLDDQRAARSSTTSNEVMVDARRGQQARNRRELLAHAAIRQDQDRVARVDGVRRLRIQLVERSLQTGRAISGAEQHRERHRAESLQPDVPQLGQLAIVDDRVADADLPAALGLRTEQVALRTDRRLHRRDQLFADRVERRIRHLREELLEVVVQQPGFVGQDRQRCVGTHRTNRLFAGASHRLEQLLDVLARVAERLLATQHGLVIRLGQVRRGRYGLDRNQVLLQPLGVGVLASQLVLDLVVRDDAPLFGVDQEHLPRVEPFLDDDILRWNVEDADFGRK